MACMSARAEFSSGAGALAHPASAAAIAKEADLGYRKMGMGVQRLGALGAASSVTCSPLAGFRPDIGRRFLRLTRMRGSRISPTRGIGDARPSALPGAPAAETNGNLAEDASTKGIANCVVGSGADSFLLGAAGPSVSHTPRYRKSLGISFAVFLREFAAPGV